jgi:hypothetical protein
MINKDSEKDSRGIFQVHFPSNHSNILRKIGKPLVQSKNSKMLNGIHVYRDPIRLTRAEITRFIIIIIIVVVVITCTTVSSQA